MKTKSILKYVYSFLGITIILFGVLMVHLQQVSTKKIDHATMQISRIDFLKIPEPETRSAIKKALTPDIGIYALSWKDDHSCLIVLHDNLKIQSNQVFTTMPLAIQSNAQLFKVPKNLTHKQVCPMSKNSSVMLKLSQSLTSIFN